MSTAQMEQLMAAEAARAAQQATPRAAGVYGCIVKVSAEIAKDGIGKTHKNDQQGYRFRGIDDVMNALAPMLAKAGLVILPRCLSRDVVERQSKSGGTLFCVVVEVEFDFVCAADGSTHTVRMFGEAMDSADKATNKAMSAAYKYAAFQAFCIPTEGEDADETTHELAAAPAPTPPAILPARGKRENQAAATGETRGAPLHRGTVAASPAPADGSPQLGLLITKIDSTSIPSSGKPKWYIHTDDGNKSSTIDSRLAMQAQQCEASGLRVQLELENTKWGYNLKRIFQIQAPTGPPPLPEIQLRGDLQEHTEPLNEEDIPFAWLLALVVPALGMLT